MKFLPGVFFLLWLLMSPTLVLAADTLSTANVVMAEQSDSDGKTEETGQEGEEEEEPDCE